MIWLVLAILLDFGFIQLFKLARWRGHAPAYVVPANYLTLGLGLGTWLLLADPRWPAPVVLLLGLVAGTLFLCSMLATNHAFGLAPSGAVLTPFRLSIVLPVALGVFLWHEPISPPQIAGLGLTLVALLLMTLGPGAGPRPAGRGVLGWLVLIFLLQGLASVALRSVHHLGLDPWFVHIIAVAGLVAGTLGFAFARLRGLVPTAGALRVGLGIGAYNVIAFPIFMTALTRTPGTIFFPLLAGSVVVLDNLCAHFVWREKLSRQAIVGVAVALVALGLILA